MGVRQTGTQQGKNGMGKRREKRKRGPDLPWRQWVLLAAMVLALGALGAYVVTRDQVVLSWVTGLVGTAFGTAIGSSSR
jgi:hypothetical protein